MAEDDWIEITGAEFAELWRLSVLRHTIGFCTPPINFYWDAEGAKHSDLSFGQHSFLKEIEAANYGEPYVWPAQFWKLKTKVKSDT